MSIRCAFGHFRTVTKHRHAVFYYCCRVGIPWQGLKHDLSKFSPIEFSEGARYWTGTRSPNETSRERFGYSAAWLHHKGRNRHHFEYWRDIVSGQGGEHPVRMPFRYLLEMFCDRVGASRVYRGKEYDDSYPLQYFLRGKGKRVIDPQTSDLMERWLRMLSEEGEEKTLAYLKKLNKIVKKEGEEFLYES